MERQVTIDNVATEGDIDKSSSDDDTPYYYYCWLSATVCTCFLTAFLAFALKSLLTKYFAGDGCCASTETYSRGTEEPVASPEAKETKKEVEEQPPEKSVANGDAAPEEIEKTATNVESKATPETKSEEVPKPVNEAPVENVKEKEVENAPPAEAPKPPVEEPKVEEPKVPVEEPKPVEPVVEETKEVRSEEIPPPLPSSNPPSSVTVFAESTMAEVVPPVSQTSLPVNESTPLSPVKEPLAQSSPVPSPEKVEKQPENKDVSSSSSVVEQKIETSQQTTDVISPAPLNVATPVEQPKEPATKLEQPVETLLQQTTSEASVPNTTQPPSDGPIETPTKPSEILPTTEPSTQLTVVSSESPKVPDQSQIAENRPTEIVTPVLKESSLETPEILKENPEVPKIPTSNEVTAVVEQPVTNVENTIDLSEQLPPEKLPVNTPEQTLVEITPTVPEQLSDKGPSETAQEPLKTELPVVTSEPAQKTAASPEQIKDQQENITTSEPEQVKTQEQIESVPTLPESTSPSENKTENKPELPTSVENAVSSSPLSSPIVKEAVDVSAVKLISQPSESPVPKSDSLPDISTESLPSLPEPISDSLPEPMSLPPLDAVPEPIASDTTSVANNVVDSVPAPALDKTETSIPPSQNPLPPTEAVVMNGNANESSSPVADVPPSVDRPIKQVVKEIEPVINNEIGQGDRQPEGEVKENKEPTAAAVEE